MFVVRRYLAVICAMLLAAPAGGFAGQAPQSQPSGQPAASEPSVPGPAGSAGTGIIGAITNPYRPVTAPPNSLVDSTRLEALLRAGNLYLSLQDTIALALENNLDIAIERYGQIGRASCR